MEQTSENNSKKGKNEPTKPENWEPLQEFNQLLGIDKLYGSTKNTVFQPFFFVLHLKREKQMQKE